MSTKGSRSGGKYGGNHTTVIPAAELLCDIADSCLKVTKISPGYIKMGLRSVGGQRRVKISDSDEAILLSVRDNTSHQEVRVWADDHQEAKLAIARGARANGLHISFGNYGPQG